MYGIERPPMVGQIELIGNYPANVARSLLEGSIDAGLVPVAIMPLLSEKYIISEYCISSFGKVSSVGIFSDCPLEEVEELYLDYQSRTSVQLAQILLREYWQLSPRIVSAPKDFLSRIGGKSAAVLIGDRALRQHAHSKFYYDLGEAWTAHTGLPFVFAAWVSRIDPGTAFIEAFNKANALGFHHLDEIIAAENYGPYPLDIYYRQNIQYLLSEAKLQAMELFWEKMKISEEFAVSGVG